MCPNAERKVAKCMRSKSSGQLSEDRLTEQLKAELEAELKARIQGQDLENDRREQLREKPSGDGHKEK